MDIYQWIFFIAIPAPRKYPIIFETVILFDIWYYDVLFNFVSQLFSCKYSQILCFCTFSGFVKWRKKFRPNQFDTNHQVTFIHLLFQCKYFLAFIGYFTGHNGTKLIIITLWNLECILRLCKLFHRNHMISNYDWRHLCLKNQKARSMFVMNFGAFYYGDNFEITVAKVPLWNHFFCFMKKNLNEIQKTVY